MLSADNLFTPTPLPHGNYHHPVTPQGKESMSSAVEPSRALDSTAEVGRGRGKQDRAPCADPGAQASSLGAGAGEAGPKFLARGEARGRSYWVSNTNS